MSHALPRAARPRAPKARNFTRFLGYVAPYKWFLILAVIGGIGKFTIPLLVPELIRHLLDEVFLNPALTQQAQLRELYWWTGGLAALFALVWMPLVYVRHYFAGMAGQRSVFDLRCELYYRILRMSSSFFARNKSGAIVSRLINDIEIVQSLVGNAMTNVWMDFASLVVVLALLFRIDPALTAVALVTFPLYLYFFRRFGRDIKASAQQVQQELSVLSGNAQEKIAGRSVVHAFAQERREAHTFKRGSSHLLHSVMRSIHFQSANVAITGILSNLAPLIVILYGGYRVIDGSLSVGELVAVTMYLNPLYLPLQRFSELNAVFANSLAALDRVFEILDEQSEIRDRPGALKLAPIRGEVEFQGVRFGYEAGEAPVLSEVSFRAAPGQKVALVGPSGSGKSTIISLIPRFYDPDAGAVLIDGQDLRGVTLQSLRSQISMVLQTPVLFSGSVRENILYGRPGASDQEVVEACEAANALDFISRLPKGLATEVGEGGSFLSGGQRQRITIARAFLKNPRILVLDEPTSALDLESERLIQAALERLMRGRTTFIIAHRLSTIVGADVILVMNQGRIVDSGSHAQLLARQGLYRDLYRQYDPVEA